MRYTPVVRPRFAAVRTIAALILFGIALLTASGIGRARAQNSPSALFVEFERAYEARDVEAYGALLTADFRFYFGDAENSAARPDGWGRDDELASADHLFHGFVDRTGVFRPAAVAIALNLEPITIGPDPEHPDDPERYRYASARAVSLLIDFGAAGQELATGRHDFWLVRGDVAQRTRNQAGDTEHWYIRRWVENPREDALVAELAPTPAPDPDVQAASVQALASVSERLWSVVPNPSRAQGVATVMFEVPAGGALVDASVYDVAGRQVCVLERGRLEGGRASIRWTGTDQRGRAAGAGVYFLRIAVGTFARTMRIVRVD